MLKWIQCQLRTKGILILKQEPIKKVDIKAFKYICATCRHLSAVETGREFDKILDTEYTLFTCKIRGWKKKEFYLMAPINESINDTRIHICEFWEQWTPETEDFNSAVKQESESSDP